METAGQLKDKCLIEILAFLQNPLNKVLLIKAQAGTDFTFLLQRYLRNNNWQYVHFNVNQISNLESQHTKDRLKRVGIFLFTGFNECGLQENMYIKYGLDNWAAKSIFICDDKLLHPILDASLYFAPIRGNKIQKHLFDKIDLTSLHLQEKLNGTEAKSSIIEMPELNMVVNTSLHAHFLNKKLMSRDKTIMEMLADRVLTDKTFNGFLFKLVYASRNDDSMQLAASNAISCLNIAGVSLARKNFSFINIPSANLAGANLHHTIFYGANLAKANFNNAILLNVDFTEANMQDVDFSEYPSMDCVNGDIAFLDGRMLAAITTLEEDQADSLVIYNFIEQEPFVVIKHEIDNVFSYFLSNNGHFLLIKGRHKITSEGTIYLWDILANKFLNKWRLEYINNNSSDQFCPAFSLDDRMLAIAEKASIKVIDLKSCQIVKSINLDIVVRLASVIELRFSCSSMLLAYSSEKYIYIFKLDQTTNITAYKFSSNCSNGPVVIKLNPEYGEISYSLCFDRSDTWLFNGQAKDIFVWDIAYGKLLAKLSGHDSFISTLDVTPRNDILVSGSQDCTIRIWSINSFECLRQLAVLPWFVKKVLIHPYLDVVGSISYGRVNYWNLVSDETYTKVLKINELSTIAYDIKKRLFAIYTECKASIYTWNADSNHVALVRVFEESNAVSKREIYFDSQNLNLYIISIFSEAKIIAETWDLESNIVIACKIFDLSDIAFAIPFSLQAESAKFVFADNIGTVRDNFNFDDDEFNNGLMEEEIMPIKASICIFDMRKQTVDRQWYDEMGFEVTALTFCNDNQYLAARYTTGNVAIIDITTEQYIQVISFSSPIIGEDSICYDMHTLVYSPCDNYIVFSNGTNSLRFWNHKDKFFQLLSGPEDSFINAFCFIASNLLAVGINIGLKGFLAIFDINTQSCLIQFKAHNSYIMKILKLDGMCFATASNDFSVQVWHFNYDTNNLSLTLEKNSRPELATFNCNAKKAKNLSETNRALLKRDNERIQFFFSQPKPIVSHADINHIDKNSFFIKTPRIW